MSSEQRLRKPGARGARILPIDVELAMAPAATYDRLARERATGSLTALAGRIVFAIAIIGTCVAIAATGRATVESVAVIGLSWSFALVIQAVAAAAIILPAQARTVTALRAFELWFQAHVPWSFWLLVSPLVSTDGTRRMPDDLIAVGAVAALAWTGVLLHAFARTVLQVRRAGAAAALHQLIVWGLALCYIAYAIGGWDRVLAEVGL
jgi:hypothetical protein